MAAHMARLSLPILLTLLAVGCGGEQTRLSHQELIEEAGAVCSRVDDEVESLPAPQSLEELSELLDQLIPMSEQGIDDLQALKPPATDEETYDVWSGKWSQPSLP